MKKKNICVDNCRKDDFYIYEYNNTCYSECPSKTKSNENYLCKYLNCSKYYNFNLTDCIDEIPEGYYLNDTYKKL